MKTEQAVVRRVERVRQEPKRREVLVVGVEQVGANLVSVRFEGEDLGDFQSPGFDDHVKFIFRDEHGELQKRDITPRRFSNSERTLILEFAKHAGGAACRWAELANRGDVAVIGGPKGSAVVARDYPWQLLAGDLTATPAIARRLEELPPGVRAHVFILADDPEDCRPFASLADVTVEWAFKTDQFEELLGAFQRPDDEGFVWFAGEASLASRVRELFVTQKQHPRHAMRIAGYWKADEPGYHKTLEKGAE